MNLSPNIMKTAIISLPHTKLIMQQQNNK